MKGTLAHLLERLSTDPNVRGEQLERVCKWFLETDPFYKSELRKVWRWKDWPGAWGRDAGIDLIAQARSGELWAIQAKCYSPQVSVTKADIDSFLSESARPEIAFRLLIATTFLSPAAQRALSAQEKRAGTLLLPELQRWPGLWPASPENLASPKPRPKRPKPHQKEAVRAVAAGFRGNDSGQLIMACGTGKTLTAVWIAQEIKSTRTLVLCPSLSLLAQTLQEWALNYEGPVAFLPVCSDETVAKTSDLGVPVTTDPRRIAAFLRRERKPLVVISTYQSSLQIAKAFKRGAPRFHLIVADEAHRTAGPASSEFATVLDRKRIPSKKRLFMTATPRYFSESIRSQGTAADWEVASMDDEVAYGPVFHRLTFGEAITRDLLSDYRVAIVGVDEDAYRQMAEHGRLIVVGGKRVTDARSVATQIAVAKAMRKFGLRRTITFHNRVLDARTFVDRLSEVIPWLPARQRPKGKLWATHVSGNMSAAHRLAQLNQLREISPGELGLISNARCLTEGIDVPALDCVAFIDPRGSQVDIIQAVGRAIRKAPDKKLGTVLLPVFVDPRQSEERQLEDSAFKAVWAVLKALRAHDSQLGDELDALRRELGRRGARGLHRPAKIVVDLPTRVGRAFLDAFDVRLIEESTLKWEFWLGLLERFAKREGHCEVPGRHQECGHQLGGWVNNQRRLYLKGRLLSPRQKTLDAIPGWMWKPHEEKWWECFAVLKRFADREGHARVPITCVVNGFNLGHWVSVQRAYRNQGKLPKPRQLAIERLPGWEWDAFDEAWRRGFVCLKEFLKREGHLRVPREHFEGDFALGSWVANQRSQRKRGGLQEQRCVELEKLPHWTWDALEAAWELGFRYLQQVVEREGHADVPPKHVEKDGFRLWNWIRMQRSRYAVSKLSEIRIRRLESLPGWEWDLLDAKWQAGLAFLREFVKREGHCKVLDNHREAGHPLGTWVATQRQLFREGRLVSTRQKRLEAIRGWVWSPLGASWNEFFLALKQFVKTQGHARVPATYVVNGKKLGQWVSDQRRRCNQGKLPKRRQLALERLTGWEWDAREERWQAGLVSLLEFSKHEGLTRVFQRRGRGALGEWVNHQRQLYRAGKLSKERQKLLEQVPGWTWGKGA